MSQNLTEINYDKLIEKSLKGVVIDALKIAEKQGLPGDNHFYISFRTDNPRVKIDEVIRTQYPQEMTIVLQHQFSDLKVGVSSFSVSLSFNNIPCLMTIPFSAITYFGDPSAQFGLSFGSEMNVSEPQEQTEPAQTASIVSIDAFRKKA